MPLIPSKINPINTDKARRSWESSLAENATRLCHTYVTVQSVGWGEFRFSTPFYFDATYLTRPYVYYGYSMNGDTIGAGGVPRCSGGVHRWIIDDKKSYTGAFVMITADLSPSYIPGDNVADENGMPPGYTIDHYFYFGGIGSKNLPYYKLEM